jgi:hypothetical protein
MNTKEEFHNLIDKIQDDAILKRYYELIQLLHKNQMGNLWKSLTKDEQNDESLKSYADELVISRNEILSSKVLKVPFDSSGAFRCYNTKKIKLKDILSAKDDGYSFFWESMFILYKKKYSILEIPIHLPYRTLGASKMEFRDIFKALFYLLVIFKRNI